MDRAFKLRRDFVPAVKVQTEDDISVSITVPHRDIDNYSPAQSIANVPSVKLSTNCEMRFFQRPDNAIYPGVDKTTEADFAIACGLWTSNFEPLSKAQIQYIAENVQLMDDFTPAMREFIIRQHEYLSKLPANVS